MLKSDGGGAGGVMHQWESEKDGDACVCVKCERKKKEGGALN